MNVLFCASEAAPFAASGGLGDVAGSLPRAIRNRKVACRVVMPLYGDMKQEYREKLTYITNFTVPVGWRNQYCGLFELTQDVYKRQMDAFASVISNNLNIVMKVLAAVTIILTIPSIIFGLWGSNVPVPFESSPYGFFAIIGIAALCTAVAVVVMVRKKWL